MPECAGRVPRLIVSHLLEYRPASAVFSRHTLQVTLEMCHHLALGFGDDPDESLPAGTAPAAGPGYSYLRVSTEGPSAADRLLGLFGTIVLVALGAAALAFAIYLGGRLVNLVIESFLGS